MKEFLYIASAIGLLCASGCKESSSNEEVIKLKAETEEVQPIELSNWRPTPQHKKIKSSEIGSVMDDAIRVLGPMDKVGEVTESYYPFSNRGGYDYIIQQGGGGAILGVWRRPAVFILNSEQAAPSNR